MFAGIGGFRSGLEAVGGFRCVGYCEIDPYPKRICKALYDTGRRCFILLDLLYKVTECMYKKSNFDANEHNNLFELMSAVHDKFDGQCTFLIRVISLDHYGATQMLQDLDELGFTFVPFGQGFKDKSPPSKELMRLTLDGKLAQGGRPVLRWMMDNIHVRTDPAGNIKPDKAKSTEKIDGAVATVMALDRAIRCGNDTT